MQPYILLASSKKQAHFLAREKIIDELFKIVSCLRVTLVLEEFLEKKETLKRATCYTKRELVWERNVLQEVDSEEESEDRKSLNFSGIKFESEDDKLDRNFFAANF